MTDPTARRWRLALGQEGEDALGGLSERDRRLDDSLSWLYGHERGAEGRQPRAAGGGAAPTPEAVRWLVEARRIFPQSVFETLQTHALDRYRMLELLTDPQALEEVEPSPHLLEALLLLGRQADPAVRDKLRAICAVVIAEILRRLRAEMQRALSGRRNLSRPALRGAAADVDWRRTVRENLSRWDPERRRIVPERIRYASRARRRPGWDVVLCVDQSGSMLGSLIHAAVMAAILTGIPGVRARMLLFSTEVVDVSDKLEDPLETLLSVQLGGGTDIGRAMRHAETLIERPERTVVALITDFYEGGSTGPLEASVARMVEARAVVLGLAALDDAGGEPVMNRAVAGRLAAIGMEVGAMTPDRFAHWLAGVMDGVRQGPGAGGAG